MMRRYHDDELVPADRDDCDDPRPIPRYRCHDGLCGALDCARCNPGHEE